MRKTQAIVREGILTDGRDCNINVNLDISNNAEEVAGRAGRAGAWASASKALGVPGSHVGGAPSKLVRASRDFDGSGRSSSEVAEGKDGSEDGGETHVDSRKECKGVRV